MFLWMRSTTGKKKSKLGKEKMDQAWILISFNLGWFWITIDTGYISK